VGSVKEEFLLMEHTHRTIMLKHFALDVEKENSIMAKKLNRVKDYNYG